MTITQADIDRAAKQTEILQRELDITNADHIALWLEASRPLDNALSWLACRVIEAHEIEMAKAELAHREAERRAIVELERHIVWLSRALHILRGMCRTAGLKLGAAKADEMIRETEALLEKRKAADAIERDEDRT